MTIVFSAAGPLETLKDLAEVLVDHLDHGVIGCLELLALVLIGAARLGLEVDARPPRASPGAPGRSRGTVVPAACPDP